VFISFVATKNREQWVWYSLINQAYTPTEIPKEKRKKHFWKIILTDQKMLTKK